MRVCGQQPEAVFKSKLPEAVLKNWGKQNTTHKAQNEQVGPEVSIGLYIPGNLARHAHVSGCVLLREGRPVPDVEVPCKQQVKATGSCKVQSLCLTE